MKYFHIFSAILCLIAVVYDCIEVKYTYALSWSIAFVLNSICAYGFYRLEKRNERQ